MASLVLGCTRTDIIVVEQGESYRTSDTHLGDPGGYWFPDMLLTSTCDGQVCYRPGGCDMRVLMQRVDTGKGVCGGT